MSVPILCQYYESLTALPGQITSVYIYLHRYRQREERTVSQK